MADSIPAEQRGLQFEAGSVHIKVNIYQETHLSTDPNDGLQFNIITNKFEFFFAVLRIEPRGILPPGYTPSPICYSLF